MSSVGTMSVDLEPMLSLTVHHGGKPHVLGFPPEATLAELSDRIARELSVPAQNQKFTIAKLGLLRPPFADPDLALRTLVDKKITLIGATSAETTSILQASVAASRQAHAPRGPKPVQAYKTRDHQREAEEARYTFHSLLPLAYLPNPARSRAFLQRLKDDPGIRAAMRKHRFSVPLLTEMNPVEHTTSDHEGTSRTLGLNRNKGEVIELRLRTDAYDGYRDYKTIRKTLCHELAHCVFGPHDRDFWNLCGQIEKEVDAADWRSGGRSVGDAEYYSSSRQDDEVHDHGGWTGGEFVLGVGGASGASATDASGGTALTRREILARAADERARKEREAAGQERER